MGVARRTLIDAALAACRRCLEELGFKRRARYYYTVDLVPQVLGTVWLSTATHLGDGSMTIAPHVGVRHQAVERCIGELSGKSIHRYAPPTISAHVGSIPLVRQALWVRFAPDDDLDAAARQVCEPIAERGVPWMRAHIELEAIYAALQTPPFRLLPGNQAVHQAVIAWLMGRPDLAHQHIEDELLRLHREELPGSRLREAEFRQFATALERRMAHDGTAVSSL